MSKGKRSIVAIAGLVFLSLAGTILFTPGRVSELRSGCKPTVLALTPVSVLSAAESATLEARLTSGGKPLVGAGISFFVIGNGPNGWTGQSVGGADTDTDGVARLKFAGGLHETVPLDHQITGYQAELRAAGSVKSPAGDYCRTTAKSELTR